MLAAEAKKYLFNLFPITELFFLISAAGSVHFQAKLALACYNMSPNFVGKSHSY